MPHRRWDIRVRDILAANEKISGIPWRGMRDMRNLLADEYFGVNTRIV
jgi:uncharacterized protein with HEPN domain